MSQDNPNPYIVPGRPKYNPTAQSQTEGDAWMNQIYPGFFDPTQVPITPGDTERPMQSSPQQYTNGRTQQQPQQPQYPVNPADLMQAMQSALAMFGQPQIITPQQQVTSPTVQPIKIPLVFDLTFNIRINLDVEQNK